MWNCSYIAAQHTATVGTCTAHWLYRCKYFCSTHANAFIKRDHATKHHWHRVNITLYQKFIHIWLQFGNHQLGCLFSLTVIISSGELNTTSSVYQWLFDTTITIPQNSEIIIFISFGLCQPRHFSLLLYHLKIVKCMLSAEENWK